MGSVIGGLFGILILLLITIGLCFLAIFGISALIAYIQSRRQPFIQAEGHKSLRRKEVETLWSLAEGKKRDAKAIFKAERGGWRNDGDDGGRGWGTRMRDMVSERHAKYHFEYLPPETVELIAAFVEGKKQHRFG